MKTYLKELQNKPDHHKKRFALLASGGFTALMFITWSVVKFGGAPDVVVNENGPVNLASVQASEVEITPIGTILRDIGDSINSLKDLIKNGE